MSDNTQQWIYFINEVAMSYSSAIDFCQTIGSYFEDRQKVTTTHQPVVIKSDITPDDYFYLKYLSWFNSQKIAIPAFWTHNDGYNRPATSGNVKREANLALPVICSVYNSFYPFICRLPGWNVLGFSLGICDRMTQVFSNHTAVCANIRANQANIQANRTLADDCYCKGC